MIIFIKVHLIYIIKMNKNFLIQINNSKELEENNIVLTNSNVYYYWCDKQELEKTSLFYDDNYSHISCFLSSKEDRITNLVNDGYILIFIKTPKILYGIVKVDSIIMKSLPEKNYLEDDDEEYTNDLINNKSITINQEKYNKLVDKYKLVQVPKMFIVKFKHLYYFEYEIGIKKFNDYIKNNLNIELKQSFVNFKYPHKVQNKEMVKCYNKDFITNFLNYLNHLNLQDKIIIEANTDLLSLNSLTSLSETNDTESTTNKINKFCIPVLWKGCDIINNMLIKSKPNKKIIQEHYLNCMNCEINDNNNKLIKLNDKKMVIKNINSSNDIKLFDYIVDKYSNVENLNIIDVLTDIKLEKDKINIISCPKSQSIYKNCFFIIE